MPAEAVDHFRQCLRRNPERVDALNNLGVALSEQGFLDEAIDCFQRALQRQPDYAAAYTSLGNAYKDQGRLNDATACFRHVPNLAAQTPAPTSNMLHCLHYDPAQDAAALFAELRRWEQSVQKSLNISTPVFSNDPSLDRTLRVGYISPDFRARRRTQYLAAAKLSRS